MNTAASKVTRREDRNIFNGIAWLVKTILIAALSPYALVALFLALAAILGMSSNDVHQIIVSMAALDADSWANASLVWHSFSMLCYTVVIVIQVHTSKPVQSFYGKLETSIGALILLLARVGSPVYP